MYSFNFYYDDDKNRLFQHIVRAEYSIGSSRIVVSGDELLSHCFPLDETLHIFSDSASFSVSEKQLRYLEILKEN